MKGIRKILVFIIWVVFSACQRSEKKENQLNESQHFLLPSGELFESPTVEGISKVHELGYSPYLGLFYSKSDSVLGTYKVILYPKEVDEMEYSDRQTLKEVYELLKGEKVNYFKLYMNKYYKVSVLEKLLTDAYSLNGIKLKRSIESINEPYAGEIISVSYFVNDKDTIAKISASIDTMANAVRVFNYK